MTCRGVFCTALALGGLLSAQDTPAAEGEDGDDESRLPSFSAEILFPDTLIEVKENANREINKRLTINLLNQIKDIEEGRRHIDSTDRNRQTALMMATALHNRLAVCYLIARGANVKIRNRFGKTALDYATDQELQDLLKVCMDEDTPLTEEEIAGIEDTVGTTQDELRSRLWDSVNFENNVREVADLIKYGVDMNGYVRGKLIIESDTVQPESLAWLVRRGYNVNARTQEGKAAIRDLTRSGIAKLLLALGMQLDGEDTDQHALMWSVLTADHSISHDRVEETAATAEADTQQLPRVEVAFDRIADQSVFNEDLLASFCASGRVFMGRMDLYDETGRCIVSQEVQTGGWMSRNSPFKRQGLAPRNARLGSYDPSQYPDTAFPVLEEETSVETIRTGSLKGFRIPDPVNTGRTSLMIHASERYGSEGCISATGGEKWAIFCEKMAHLRAQGVESIPLRVVYTCTPPDMSRTPSAAAAAAKRMATASAVASATASATAPATASAVAPTAAPATAPNDAPAAAELLPSAPEAAAAAPAAPVQPRRRVRKRWRRRR